MTKGTRTPIDWDAVHRRVEEARCALQQDTALPSGKAEEIFRQRARELAREAPEEPFQERIEILEFLLAHEHYALETSWIREVCRLTTLTPIPCTPAFVLGITSIRGRLTSVVDIKTFFELPDQGLTDLNKVIVIRNDTMEFGILADAVHGVRSIPVATLQPPLPTLTGIRQDYLRGVAPRRLIVLNGGVLLSDPRLVVREEIGL